jgi:hypothetical protein
MFTKQAGGSWLFVGSHAKGTWQCVDSLDSVDWGLAENSLGTVLNTPGTSGVRIFASFNDNEVNIASGSFTVSK